MRSGPRPPLRRVLRAAAAVLVVGVLSVAVGAPTAGAAEVEITVPDEIGVGRQVTVTATVTDGGEPVAGAEVALAYLGRIGGVSDWIVVGTGSTGDDGLVTFTYLQRALNVTRMRVEYMGEDGPENTEFTVVVVDGPQLEQSDAGADLPVFGVGWLLVVLAIVWTLILLAAARLLVIGRSSDHPAGPARIIPRMIVGFVTLTAMGMLVVVLTKPQSHANLSPTDDFDRTPRALVGVQGDYLGLGLGELDPDHDVSGGQLFVQSGCASCHGPQGGGALVGGSVTGEDAARSVEALIEEVREGPKAMPAFDDTLLTDADIAEIFAFLDDQ